MTEHFFLYNDEVYPSGSAVISAGNRSLRYGDGLFETMKLVKGVLVNREFHFERLFGGLSLLQFEVLPKFTARFLETKIVELAAKNNHIDIARVRIMIFRGDGGIFAPENLLPNYIIETSPLSSEILLNKKGLVIDIFPDARKSCDLFSNIKSNNYLPYVMAALFAQKNKLDDSIVLNSYDRICDSVIANVFIINGNTICTPPLSDGCVAGTMRRWLLEKFTLKKYSVTEKSISIEDALNADEFFLTNAISLLRWVENFRNKTYGNSAVKEIYNHILQTI